MVGRDGTIVRRVTIHDVGLDIGLLRHKAPAPATARQAAGPLSAKHICFEAWDLASVAAQVTAVDLSRRSYHVAFEIEEGLRIDADAVVTCLDAADRTHLGLIQSEGRCGGVE